ncbi:proline aminopeptidase [Nautilia profundicola AmH]|uniref:Proline aminopeptidase n=1 Tax=Nautilia profundicola (strain ATCC BAA-1463 / DSM 18972 / AmH) TaxID=598659 RepID=B9L5V8_NAUPA|nr:M24 family metallopeptidase [Nautilia profundicola]ACM93288.1 proline aminopeptidase [Nautilia profundicola AmH]
MNYILNKENEIYYECGWSSDNALFLKLGDYKYIITDGRYTLEAKEEANAEVVEARDLIKKARELILKHKIKRIVLDPLNWDYDSYNQIAKIVNIKDEKYFSHKKRMIKSENELEIIKTAVKEGAKAFENFTDSIETGIDEFELSYRFKEHLTKRGRRDLSFEPIVAINENAAKPHAKVSNKTLNKDDLLLLDAGIKYKRYCSDRTRTIAINDKISMSKYQKFKDSKIQKIYDIVLKAQLEAIKNIKIGMEICELDKIARDIISSEGYGKYFVHSLGHGVGLDIHEWPYVNSKNKIKIQEGMVFTIEPGIYIPNEFGVRIEDMVMITHDGKIKVLSEEL